MVNMHAQNQSLAAISRRLRMAPCIVARTYLEHVEEVDKSKIYKLLLSTVVMSDDNSGNHLPALSTRLRGELRECVEDDVHCSPLCDRIRRSEGDEYEHLMVLQLTQLGIPFENEHMLRERGLAKTPDALLVVPIQVKVNDTWHVVQWIDSKAMAHEAGTENEAQHTAQAHAYVNRFGPGMLVYWHGVGSDRTTSPSDDVIVVDAIPPTFLFPGQKFNDTQSTPNTRLAGTTLAFEPMQVVTTRDDDGIPSTAVFF
ncbi:hypothetical protein DYB32_005922 [Aphanomyces invadans]|nr:hypothetical protein DYB32_005922 [Aphanomyces invadans]